jgi:hypothetical protein
VVVYFDVDPFGVIISAPFNTATTRFGRLARATATPTATSGRKSRRKPLEKLKTGSGLAAATSWALCSRLKRR